MNAHTQELVDCLKKLISFQSVLKPKFKNMPFGEDTANALNYILQKANDFGFTTNNYDNYIGEIVWGIGEPIAILCHIDVVPAGPNWETPPFEGVVVDNKIYGRGAVDNKGPIVAVLYALKQLRDSGFTPKREIRFIIGCNEEAGWNCIDHYKTIRPLPEVGFSPDGDFPAIFAEKGILHVECVFSNLGESLKSIVSASGGERFNMVAPNAEITTKLPESSLKNFDCKMSTENCLTVLRFSGISGHASTPQRGENAIWKMVDALQKMTKDTTISFIADKLCNDIYGKKLGIACNDIPSGNLTMNIGLFKLEDDQITVGIDIRYPVTFHLNLLVEKLKGALPHNCELVIKHNQPPLYTKEESPLIQLLLDAYSKAMNTKKAKPIAIGGGTYARAIKHGVAFGPVFPNTNSTAHMPNEFISIGDLEKLEKIYFEAIKNICS